MEEEIKTPSEEIGKEEPGVDCLSKIKLHKFKILGGILVVFVFVGAVFGAYKVGQRSIYPEPVERPTPTPVVVATPTPDPTANWKTYTNTKFGYRLQYPLNYITNNGVVDIQTDKNDSPLLFLYSNESGRRVRQFFVIMIYKNPPPNVGYNGLDYDPFTTNIKTLISSEPGDLMNIGNTFQYKRLQNEQIDGRNALVFETYDSKRLVVETNDYFYIIALDNNANQIYIQKILYLLVFH